VHLSIVGGFGKEDGVHFFNPRRGEIKGQSGEKNMKREGGREQLRPINGGLEQKSEGGKGWVQKEQGRKEDGQGKREIGPSAEPHDPRCDIVQEETGGKRDEGKGGGRR